MTREPTGRSAVRAGAPDPQQEKLRADAGFPWCDTCKAPAVWSESEGMQHVTLQAVGKQTICTPIPDLSGHPIDIHEWNDADPW
jgi:hypothetical protein